MRTLPYPCPLARLKSLLRKADRLGAFAVSGLISERTALLANRLPLVPNRFGDDRLAAMSEVHLTRDEALRGLAAAPLFMGALATQWES